MAQWFFSRVWHIAVVVSGSLGGAKMLETYAHKKTYELIEVLEYTGNFEAAAVFAEPLSVTDFYPIREGLYVHTDLSFKKPDGFTVEVSEFLVRDGSGKFSCMTGQQLKRHYKKIEIA